MSESRSASPSMPLVPLALDVGMALVAALTRRARHGRPHPEWTLGYDLAMSVLRRVTHRYPEVGIRLARGGSAPLPLALRSSVQVTAGWLADLACEVHAPTRGVRQGTHRRSSASHADPTILFLHGGGYVTCSPRTHRDVIARVVAASGARAFVPDYRLAPEHPFPAALDDALACYRALLVQDHAPERLFVAGDSAGGGLAIALALRLRDLRLPLPRALLLFSPWVDLSLGYHDLVPYQDHDYLSAEATIAHALAYAGMQPLSHPLISPALSDLRGLPPMLVQTGEWELLREQNIDFVRRAQQAGVDVEHRLYPGMLHAFGCFAGLSAQGASSVRDVRSFMERELRVEHAEDDLRVKAS